MIEFKTTKEFVPIDKILPNRWNPNFMTKEVFEKQKESLRHLGFLGSIIVRKINHTSCDYEIMDGEHRWKALKEEGATECPVEIIIEEVSDTDAQLLTILLNRLRGQDDIFKKAKILAALNEKQLSLLPMTKEEIEHEKRFVVFDFAQFEAEIEPTIKATGDLVVLPFDLDQDALWKAVKGQMVTKGIVTAKSKKGQDVQMAMRLLKVWLELTAKVDEEGKATIQI